MGNRHQIPYWQIPAVHRWLGRFIASILKAGFTLLPLGNEHLVAYFNCTFFLPDHKDPFDRLLVATADFEKMAFVTKDDKFDAYKNRLPIVW